MNVEITEWWDFKDRLRNIPSNKMVTVHITTRLSVDDLMSYRIANILSLRTEEGIVYSVIGSVFRFDKLKREVEKLGIRVDDRTQPMGYAYAYGVYLRKQVIKKLAEINKEEGRPKIQVITGFYGNPEWVKELLRWV